MKAQTELELTGVKLEDKNGRLYYNGDLHLQFSDIKSLPDNLTVMGSLDFKGY